MKGDAPMFSEKKVPSAGKGLPPWLFVPTIFPFGVLHQGGGRVDSEEWLGAKVKKKRGVDDASGGEFVNAALGSQWRRPIATSKTITS